MFGFMESADLAVVALYFVLVLCIGFFAMWKSNRSTVSGYFLAGRSMTWVAIGASLFVSNIGSEHFIGLAGSGAASGFAVGAWELNAVLVLQLLGWVFIPVYIRSGVYTMPQYLYKRYGGNRLKVYFALLILTLYVFTKLSVDLYAGALFIRASLGWDLYLSIIILIGLTAVLTVTGGLVAVIYTDVLQAILMIGGALTLMIVGMVKVGGFEELKRRYMLASPNVTAVLASFNLSSTNTCRIHPKEDSLKMLREPTDEDIPWPGFLLGQTPTSIWYWCADQVIVQRVLAAKDLANAKGATLMAGFLKLLPMFIIVVPGMISRVLFTDEIACINPEHCMQVCGSRAGCSNIAYPRLALGILPAGLRGLMMAVMIAALMSDLDSIFNSASTIFTLDIYKHLRKAANSRELMIVGRLFVFFMVAVSIAWVPVIVEMQGGQMYLYIQEITNYLTPPVAALFLLGIFWKRCNEQGAFCGGLLGSLLGIARMILAFIYRAPDCDQLDTRPSFIKNVHYMYVSTFLFWITIFTAIVVSLLTPALPRTYTSCTTFWALKDVDSIKTIKNSQKEEYDKHTNQTMDECNGHITSLDKPDCKAADGIELVLLTSGSDDSKSLNLCILEGQTSNDDSMNGQTIAGDPETKEEPELERSKWWKLFDCICGLKNSDVKDPVATIDDEMICLQMLQERPRIKVLLNIGLLIVLSSGISMLIYFSL
ncbi:sodium/myo-inositol cotransporter-like isoform X1 [Scyliorhinus canicula]|uniref:sodium/myo-inositol cotransporter-like isoform X1 n=1 Tax=Scyliorhinus canicula TaxID=7830 RepID=UPI0018F618B0|nr:sodium/myo-inositol cotransporter-like isoform X1 [Scyliorhinus canicula]XP_038657539.1 sodium/myo-inositol cotransporter-like isoform X1 [Scyliorhinus canicula]XP_038657540.1 sodium/myo-inositol cotransporter-like isoform X1 [Scyliorhinus canicula]XP_038657541.1 sodium/myo-inositol cotransporter-like isoform X1 [Scyliorhinus canicula]XP_038657542.1 sodium/myo-inositol cotransporter-like isoform X1 [Scyliorhinus canicula]XP_038657543.1 sodium/myo-inositol cotransporter-like isoform X1 [Scyl